MKGLTTKAIHGTTSKKDPHGSLRMPVYDNVAFEFEKASHMQDAFEGRRLAHAYSRISNPTVAEFEEKVRLMADAAGVMAVSSGMAAISNVILALAETGSNIITTRFLFGNTYSLFGTTLKQWGLQTAFVDMANERELAAAISKNTRAVFLESITNPQLQVVDFKKVAKIAHDHGVPVILDGTLTTSALLQSKSVDADIEVVSSTKYMSGGATSMGGVIIDNGLFDWSLNPKLRPWAEKAGPNALLVYLRREVYRNVGACLSAHNAWLQSLGLETMALRVQKTCENALTLAKFLKTSSQVDQVNYPGLESSPSHALAAAQFKNGFGGLLTFNLKSKEQCFAFMDALKIIRRATNLNDNKTLIIHPASTIFCEYSKEEREKMGVPETMIRLSVGIEDAEDLMSDLNDGFKALEKK